MNSIRGMSEHADSPTQKKKKKKKKKNEEPRDIYEDPHFPVHYFIYLVDSKLILKTTQLCIGGLF